MPHWKRLAAAAVAAVFMTACSSGNTIGITTPTPGPAVTLTKTQQAVQADAGMAATNGVRAASLLTALLTLLTKPPRNSPAAITCNNGVETKVVTPNPGQLIAIVNLYYDPACVAPLAKSRTTVLLGSPVTVSGSQTTFDPSGKAIAYGTISGTLALGSSATTGTVTGSIARTKHGKPVMSFGMSCTLSTANACGFGAINDGIAKNADLGVVSDIDGFVGNGSSSGTISLQAYAGKPGSLTLRQGKGNAWQVSGGKRVVAQSGSFKEKVVAKRFSVALNLALNDRLNDASAAVKLDDAGISGHVIQRSNGLTAANFTTSPLGFGSIQYSNGTTGPIVLFVAI
jgi:hypothetical protein